MLLGWAAVAYVPEAVHTTRVEYRKVVASPRLIHDYLRSHTVRKLQIGTGGNNKRDWLNTDLEPAPGQAFLDATPRFPLPDGSFHYVFSEHVIEHLSYEDGMTMLKESYRVLAPGGRVRIATPDLLRFVALFQPSKSDEARHHMDEKLRVHEWPRTTVPEAVILNLQLRSFGHQFV